MNLYADSISKTNLRSKTVKVSGEHGSLTDICCADKLHYKSLKTDSQTAVRGETILVALKITLEIVGVKSLSLHLLYLLVVIVDTLTARGYLKTSEKKVEFAGCSWILLVVHCIEWRL